MPAALFLSPSWRGGLRRTPLAWRNLTHRKLPLLVSLVAVGFAAVIMFLELGLLNGLYDSQTSMLNAFRADLVLRSRTLHIFNAHVNFPRSQLAQVAGVRGVQSVYPIYVEDRLSDLRDPAGGICHVIRVLAFNPEEAVFLPPEIESQAGALRAPLTILFDRKSRPFFGSLRPGMTTELGPRTVTVAGTFGLGPDYYYDGNVLTSADTLFTLFPNQTRDNVYLGLVQLVPGMAPGAVQRELQRLLAPDIEVLKKSELVAREKAEWQKATPAGYIFIMGVAVGFVIGVFICYQILYTEISDRLPQLATLKALGYRNGDLLRLVLTQAVLLGLLGFVPAVVATSGLYALLTAATGIITQLTVARVALVFALTLGMCLMAGLFAVRKALAIDPAELF